ncbi:hypothetical protein SCHPADRAFT_487946 [Schizopora paradoxa]|uniref:Uncharacterized protein n=1 Tax=Schizopora paradoxa TaxID=27342 RepID=A0A0H2RHM1_9AGAM|nr:hypothetical protein SCHPADRAFT_487946 [Schizopora paradoxa]
MSRLGGPFSDRPLTIQWECQRVSSGAVKLVESLFEETKLLHLPQLKYIPNDDLDDMTKLRLETESLNQQQIVAELELETLRRAILTKEAELEKSKVLQVEQLVKTNQLISSRGNGTTLPVTVILRIFEYLLPFASGSRDIRDTPLYRISEGFSDLPKWKAAIIGLIPIVLINKSSLYREALVGMSRSQLAYLTHNPRIIEFGDEDKLASVDKNEAVTVVLKGDQQCFGGHLKKAKEFRWRTLVILCNTPHVAQEMLSACGERLYRLRHLEVSMERRRPPGIHLMQYAHSHGEPDDWASVRDFDLPPMPSDVTHPSLQYAHLPLGALPHFKQLTSRLKSARIVVPKSTGSIGDVLRGLQNLSSSLIKLSIRHERDTSHELRTDGMVTVTFPNLVELSLSTFEGRAMNVLLDKLDCPNLRILRASPSAVSARKSSTSGYGNIASDEEDAEVQAGFPEIVHKRFPKLKSLTYMCSSLSSRAFLERMSRRNDQGGGTIVAPVSAFLIPCLETLCPTDLRVDDVALLVALASSRLREFGVASLRSVHVSRSSNILKEFGHGSTADFWLDCHVDALCLLVPDMQFASAGRYED